jgi:hypothetical protein
MPVAVASIPPLPAVPLKSVSEVLTSGQQDPDLSLLKPYSEFPKEVTGRTVWSREDFVDNESLWKRTWTPEHIAALNEAYDKFAATDVSIPEINRVSWKERHM